MPPPEAGEVLGSREERTDPRAPRRPQPEAGRLLSDITSPQGCVLDAAPGTRKRAPRHPQSTLSSGRIMSVSAGGNRL